MGANRKTQIAGNHFWLRNRPNVAHDRVTPAAQIINPCQTQQAFDRIFNKGESRRDADIVVAKSAEQRYRAVHMGVARYPSLVITS